MFTKGRQAPAVKGRRAQHMGFGNAEGNTVFTSPGRQATDRVSCLVKGVPGPQPIKPGVPGTDGCICKRL